MVNVGDKVGFKVDYVNGGDQVVGTVEDIYEHFGKILIVKDGEKNLFKVREADVIVFEDVPVEEETRDPGEDMITISRKDLAKISFALIENCSIGVAHTVICADFSDKLIRTLFDGVDRG